MSPLKKINSRSIGCWIAQAFVLVSILLISGCQSYLADYSSAQKHFDTASQLQASKVFEPVLTRNLGDESIAYNQIHSHYAVALKLISEVIDTHEKELKQDQLLGNAFTIKAISQWKLGQTKDALSTKKQALENQQLLYPRDKALMTALPGLIKAEQANSKRLNKEPYLGTLGIREMILGGNGAMNDFNMALKALDQKHPVRIYIIMTQIASIRILHSATLLIPDLTIQKEERTDLIETYFKPLRKELITLLKEFEIYGESSSENLLLYFNRIFGSGPD
ncbi:MAG TPA: hypothetical protein DHV36_05725 [Desulfobacteraceae bacterium]|nr:hypothetical protein [Desulfobacteraceae bacterium]|tara:strand:+ start:1180 stop:2016 length:837 start_codon:yes stop_codon:yes gene_type:complete